ncbi:hypothetical protein RN001_010694 [Aquatica leii]|uniref:Deacetylase sirtuin-type domain-containing protein n=1 Tax=Aquatica leii TaxID=1421715 RepID=A0AAN7SNE5_9COLE|nr:hypothetical protein RN001_010694 [Aquatica leii]
MVRKIQIPSSELSFVPKHFPPTETDIALFKQFIAQSRKLFVLTGAGISTESGIPDYRSENVGLYARTNHKPILHNQFVTSDVIRKRYWARNYIGWERFSQSQPNFTHYWLKDLEILHSKVNVTVTQNVDNLHFKAGSKNVIELHGTAFKVLCLTCGNRYNRYDIQNVIKELNPNMTETSTMIRPDGDVEIAEEAIRCFQTPVCGNCGGVLKPDIVFFGDNVPQSRVVEVQNYVTDSDGVLVLGSSLFVYSGFRIIMQAMNEVKKIVIVNIGQTRGDKYADIKIAAKCGDVLKHLNIC